MRWVLALSDSGLYGPAAECKSSDRKHTLGKISLAMRQGCNLGASKSTGRTSATRLRAPRSLFFFPLFNALSSASHSRLPCDASFIEGTATLQKRAREKTPSSREREDRGGGAIPLLRAFDDGAGSAPATLRLRDEEQWILRRALVAVVGQAVIGAASERDAVRSAPRLGLDRDRRRLLLQLLPRRQAAASTLAASQKPRRCSAGWNGSFSVTSMSDFCRRRRFDAGGPALANGRVARS